MSGSNIGNSLNQIVSDSRSTLFEQGELAQLTYGAFDIAARAMQDSEQEQIEVTFPVGWRPDKIPMNSTRTYRKDELLGRYQLLAFNHLAINGIIQLVAIVEAMLGDVVRTIILKYPQKLSAKRTMNLKSVLEAASIEEVHLRATVVVQ
jgi:hypothetical protein